MAVNNAQRFCGEVFSNKWCIARAGVMFRQLPFMLGAILFINSKKGFFGAETDLIYSLVLLVLLVVFVIEGSGPLSLSTFFREVEAEKAAETRA